MKKLALIISMVALAAGPLLAGDSLRIMEGLSMHSRILNQDVKYSVCLPEDYYKNERSYPVVYMLHGLGDDETAWLEYGRISQYYDAEFAKGNMSPMIFIMPEGYRTYYVNDYKGTFLYEDMFIKEMVPYIDSLYRTMPEPQYRGLIGYSMGGFGALSLHLKHPDIFGSAVPLSISIRTDEQYMTEYAPEWNEQWGRLFGAVGIEGPGRITEYYKKNCPFHVIPEIPASEYNKFRIYIDNGDDEQTLCRSNEELHILMRSLGFPHKYRVRDGGHSFGYWCSALPNALHFLSDAFQVKPYHGDVHPYEYEYTSDDELQLLQGTYAIGSEMVFVYQPGEMRQTNRLYPALYIAGNLSSVQQRRMASLMNKLIKSNIICPMEMVFLSQPLLDQFDSVYPEIEKKFRIRPGYRFRSLMGFQQNASQVSDIAINQVQFSSCVIADGFLQKNDVIKMIDEMPADALKKTPFFIVTTDKGDYYEGNGYLHMMLRDKEIKHEYRVVEGTWRLEDRGTGGLEEIILFVAENFHR